MEFYQKEILIPFKYTVMSFGDELESRNMLD